MSLETDALNNLIKRRNKLQAAYDELADQPQSYTIQGSVSETKQKMADLRREIDAITAQITTLLHGGDGIRRIYPNYNNPMN